MAQTIKLRHKGQITLPSEIRESLDLDQGDSLIVEIIDGKIVMTRPIDVVKRTAGVFAAYAKDGPVGVDRDKIWGEIAEERDGRVKRQITEGDAKRRVAEEKTPYDPD